MNGSKGHDRSRQRGQGLVEFALIAPLLFLLIIGIIEAGRLVFYFHTLNEVTREGARYAIVHGENAFDGCPSGPMPPPDTNTCDPSAQNIKDRILNSGANALAEDDPGTVDCEGLRFGWPGDTSFPIYGPTPTNAQGNDVTIRVEYCYSPIVLLDLFGPVTIQAEATLVINN